MQDDGPNPAFYQQIGKVCAVDATNGSGCRLKVHRRVVDGGDAVDGRHQVENVPGAAGKARPERAFRGRYKAERDATVPKPETERLLQLLLEFQRGRARAFGY